MPGTLRRANMPNEVKPSIVVDIESCTVVCIAGVAPDMHSDQVEIEYTFHLKEFFDAANRERTLKALAAHFKIQVTNGHVRKQVAAGTNVLKYEYDITTLSERAIAVADPKLQARRAVGKMSLEEIKALKDELEAQLAQAVA